MSRNDVWQPKQPELRTLPQTPGKSSHPYHAVDAAAGPMIANAIDAYCRVMCYSITKGPQAIRDFARALRDTTGNLAAAARSPRRRVRDARIRVAALEGELRRGHAPAGHGELARPTFRVADDWRGVVGKDAGNRRDPWTETFWIGNSRSMSSRWARAICSSLTSGGRPLRAIGSTIANTTTPDSSAGVVERMFLNARSMHNSRTRPAARSMDLRPCRSSAGSGPAFPARPRRRFPASTSRRLSRRAGASPAR